MLKRTSVCCFAVWTRDETFDGLVGKKLVGATRLYKMTIANSIKVVFRLSASHFVKKKAIRIDTQPHKIEEFLHVIDMKATLAVAMARGLKEFLNIASDVGQFRAEDGFSGKVLTQLTENPGISDTVSADHESGAAGLIEHLLRLRDRGDVAIGKDRAVKACGGSADVLVVDLAAIAFSNGPSM